MTTVARSNVVSSYTTSKGALIEETYRAFASWDLEASKAENLARLRTDNFIGAKSAGWLAEIRKVLNRRFDADGRDRPLITLARAGCPLAVWRPLLLWHMTRDEFLLRDFLIHWLFPAFERGTYRIRQDDLHTYLLALHTRGGVTEHAWTPNTMGRVASGLLKMATDFGLLEGTVHRTFASYHLPDDSFLYLLHAIREQEANPRRVVDSAEWRMYLMRPEDVEAGLLRLHQFKRLGYQVAGSIVELTLPCSDVAAFAARMVA